MALSYVKAVLILAASLQGRSRDLLKTYGGQIERPSLDRWSNNGPYNNDRCWLNTEGQSCEDVRIHDATSTVFLACGNARDRLEFYPPLQNFGGDPGKRYYEYFLKYDIQTNTTTRIKIEGWNQENDIVLHGFDILQSEENATEILVYAVNHERAGERIAVFSHSLGTDTFVFVKQYAHPWIKTPNAVAAAGLSSFYISNDNYFYDGLFRHLEAENGPWEWATQVVYCTEAEHDKLECNQVTPENAHPGANGIKLIDDGTVMMVNDAVLGTTSVYDIDPGTKFFTLNRTISHGSSVDNIELSGSGDLTIGSAPDSSSIGQYVEGDRALNRSATTPSAVFRLVKENNYAPELLFWDDGSLVSLLTASAISKKHNVMVGGALLEQFFIICNIEL